VIFFVAAQNHSVDVDVGEALKREGCELIIRLTTFELAQLIGLRNTPYNAVKL